MSNTSAVAQSFGYGQTPSNVSSVSAQVQTGNGFVAYGSPFSTPEGNFIQQGADVSYSIPPSNVQWDSAMAGASLGAAQTIPPAIQSAGFSHVPQQNNASPLVSYQTYQPEILPQIHTQAPANVGGALNLMPGFHSDPRTHVGLEAVFLNRSGNTDADFVFDDNGAALNYSDITSGTSTDLRIRWSRVDGAGKGVEFVVLKSNSFDNRTVVDGPNVVPVFFYTIPANPQPSWDIEYNTDFETYELNWWTGDSPSFRYGIGGRFINLREDFNIVQTGATNDGFFTDTDNDLFGVQLLAEYRHPVSDQTILELGNRTGIYANNIDVRAFASNGQLHREDNQFSFVGNWNAGLRFFSSGLGSWRVGYEAILLTGVASAPDQSEALELFDPGANEIVTDVAFLHGAYGGFEIKF